MSKAKGPGDTKSKSGDERKRRLADQLRANLKRRKARTRGRKADKDVAHPDKNEEDGN